MKSVFSASRVLVLAFAAISAHAQSPCPTNAAILKGLTPVSTLGKSGAANANEGNAALGANYALTGGIETGDVAQPTLLPFAEQEQQALRDAFITSKNLAELADGLGTTLGAAYIGRLHYIDQDHTSPIPKALSDLISQATTLTLNDACNAKYFFANLTTDGNASALPATKDIMTSVGGVPDIFGISYSLPGGTPGADKFGNSRPFQTERKFHRFSGLDYFNIPSDNTVYNAGPAMPLTNSPSYPSGHTTYGYTGAILLAVLVPERYSQMVTRGAEYGNDRILMGSHYVMDVLGGRTLALYDMAHLLADKNFQASLLKARNELDGILQAGCGDSIAACAAQDIGRLSNSAANQAFYSSTQTYNLPVVNAQYATGPVDVAKVAPEAGYLLTQAFPSLTLDQADAILTQTEGPGGGFLDDGSDPGFAVYSRLNLYAASQRAASFSANTR